MNVKTPKPLDLRGVVLSILSAFWGVILPWRYQVAVIMHLEFGGSLMLVQPTGSDKYLVMYGAATLLMNVIPLIALGAK